MTRPWRCGAKDCLVIAILVSVDDETQLVHKLDSLEFLRGGGANILNEVRSNDEVTAYEQVHKSFALMRPTGEDEDLEQAILDRCPRGGIEIPRSSNNILRSNIDELITGTKTLSITVLYLVYASVRCFPTGITLVMD